MTTQYEIIFNHYTDGPSGHMNVTFAGAGDMKDFTVGINL